MQRTHFLHDLKSSPGNSVGGDAGCQFRGCEFESQLGQHFFGRTAEVNITCVIRLSPIGVTVDFEK